MNSASPPQPAGRDTRAVRPPTDTRQQKIPNADMQADDAGTADSGAAEQGDSGTAATRAMKQTSKTDAESGNPR
ncbi:MAG: hypothetical protein JWQ33_727 [Ramlibacter sp.]|nr:hypothetical protein [Ramlibacter sp.]